MTKDFVKGFTSEEKFASINQTLKHFSRRLHRTILGVMPPATVFNYIELVPPDGVLLRCMFPGSAKIVRGCLFVERYLDNKTVEFVVEVHGETGATSRIFNTRKVLSILEPNLDISAGSRLILRTELPARVEGVWSGLLLEYDIKSHAKGQYLIDEFERLVEEENNASEDQEG